MVKLVTMRSDGDFFCLFGGGDVRKMTSVITPGLMLLPRLRIRARQEADGEFNTMLKLVTEQTLIPLHLTSFLIPFSFAQMSTDPDRSASFIL